MGDYSTMGCALDEALDEALRVLSDVALMPRAQLVALSDETLERLFRMYRTFGAPVASGADAGSGPSGGGARTRRALVFPDPVRALELGNTDVWRARGGGAPLPGPGAPRWVRELFAAVPFRGGVEKSPAWRAMWPGGALVTTEGSTRLLVVKVRCPLYGLLSPSFLSRSLSLSLSLSLLTSSPATPLLFCPLDAHPAGTAPGARGLPRKAEERAPRNQGSRTAHPQSGHRA